MTYHPPAANERGSALMVVVLIVVALAGLSFSMLTEALAEKGMLGLRKSQMLALENCETGIIKASLEIQAQKDSGTDGIGVIAGEHGGGTFTITSIQDADNPDRWILSAVGEHRGVKRRIEVGVRRRAGGDYVEGLFAKDTLTFNGRNQTDAYDSRLGTWVDQAVNADSGGSYAERGGHVGSNADIVVHGSSVAVRGNAIPGPSHAVQLSGSPTIWGDVMPRRRTIELQPPTLAEFEAAYATNDNDQLLPPGGGNGLAVGKGNGNGGGGSGSGNYNPKTYALRVTGQETVRLAGGTYFFSSVSLAGQSILQIDGPTVIYVLGDFDVSGSGIVNMSGKPSDLRVYAHPYTVAGLSATSSHVKVRGGSRSAMALYAPGAALTVAGDDDIFGAFVAETATISGNSRFHYDKALGTFEEHGSVVIERLYWRDLDEQLR